MIYEFKCNDCKATWSVTRKLDEWDHPSFCPKCTGEGKRVLSALPWFFNKTHPDVKQDMHELVAGEPASNFSEV